MVRYHAPIRYFIGMKMRLFPSLLGLIFASGAGLVNADQLTLNWGPQSVPISPLAVAAVALALVTAAYAIFKSKGIQRHLLLFVSVGVVASAGYVAKDSFAIEEHTLVTNPKVLTVDGCLGRTYTFRNQTGGQISFSSVSDDGSPRSSTIDTDPMLTTCVEGRTYANGASCSITVQVGSRCETKG